MRGRKILVLLALAISFAAALVGTIRAVRAAVKLPPAEAMRPEPPAIYCETILERIGLGRWLSPVTQMMLRRLERQPIKSLLSCFGISLAVAVLVLGSFLEDAPMGLINLQFGDAQREDMIITFVEPTSGEVLYDVQHLPGVMQCEAFRAVPARMRFGHRSQRLAILGIPTGMQLFRLIDAKRGVIQLPEEGVVISEKLAELLAIREGEVIRVEVLESERPVREIVVSGFDRRLCRTERVYGRACTAPTDA